VSRRLLLGGLLGLWAGAASAHKPSDAFVTFDATGDRPQLTVELPLRDLELAMGLDADGDGAITWREVSAREPDIAAWMQAGLALRRDGEPCVAEAAPLAVDVHAGEAYAVVPLAFGCGAAGPVELQYDLLFAVDPTHRVFARARTAAGEYAAVLDPDSRLLRVETEDAGGFASFLREGVWHIWIGYDHLAFLALLLLPVALTRSSEGWRAAGTAREIVWRAAAVVTAFTAAHSITLSLAALGIVNLPVQLTETAIALSVIVAGLLNVYPSRRVAGWMLASGFGLVHGFGFANVLAELGLDGSAIALPLLGFNLGVEVGQLAVVAAALPLMLLARHVDFYRRVFVPAGSFATALLAAFWLVERAAGI
jgi:hypothetical protein